MNALETALTGQAVPTGGHPAAGKKGAVKGDERGSAFRDLLKVVAPKGQNGHPDAKEPTMDALPKEVLSDIETKPETKRASRDRDILGAVLVEQALSPAPAAPIARVDAPIIQAALQAAPVPVELDKVTTADGETAPDVDTPAPLPKTDLSRTMPVAPVTDSGVNPQPIAPQLPPIDAAPGPAMPGRVTSNTETPLVRLADALSKAAPAAGDEPASPATRINVVHQETHLPPARISPMQQVVEPVRTAIAELHSELAQNDAPLARPDAVKPGEASGPTKILVLQLNPSDLGTVMIRMRLNSDRMELRIEASRPETAAMLERDRGALRDLVGSSGYLADGIAIETMPFEPRVSDRADLAQDPVRGQSGDRAGQGPDRDGNGQGAERRGQQPPSLHEETRYEAADSGPVGGDSHLYL